MTSLFLIRAAASLLALAAAAGQAQTAAATLNAPAARLSDASIDRDHQTYEAVQARLQAVNAAGRPLRDYTLAKAQCWLDVSFHEYTRNDRGAFPQDALREADRLARAMEAGGPGSRLAPEEDTPLISGAERLRPDLWAQARALRSHAGWSCAQAKAACAEVELVHAGHEQAQLQWRHAKPYVQIAEDLLAQGQALAERCEPPPPPPPPKPVVTTDKIILLPQPDGSPSAVVVTSGGQSLALDQPYKVAALANGALEPAQTDAATVRKDYGALLDMLPARARRFTVQFMPKGGSRLAPGAAAVLAQVRAAFAALPAAEVVVSGHTDRVGTVEANDKLSLARAAAVRTILVAGGLPRASITVIGRGEREPLIATADEVVEPRNRRVEIKIR